MRYYKTPIWILKINDYVTVSQLVMSSISISDELKASDYRMLYRHRERDGLFKITAFFPSIMTKKNNVYKNRSERWTILAILIPFKIFTVCFSIRSNIVMWFLVPKICLDRKKMLQCYLIKEHFSNSKHSNGCYSMSYWPYFTTVS